MRCPSGSPVRSTRAVKPGVLGRGRARHAPRLRGSASVVSHSTTSRAGRSARLQTIARPRHHVAGGDAVRDRRTRACRPHDRGSAAARPQGGESGGGGQGALQEVAASHVAPSLSARTRSRSARDAGRAGGLGRRAHDRVRHHFRGQGADQADVGLARPRAGGQREDRVAVGRRVDGRDRAREAVVGHLRDLEGLDLGEHGVGGDDADRRVLARTRRRLGGGTAVEVGVAARARPTG